MPDISMCKNNECPLKETCYRFKATPSCHQAYADFNYKDGCDYYWEIESNCKYIKKFGESCSLNENCKHPNCE